MTAANAALGGPERRGFFDALAPGGKRALFLLALAAVLFIFIFPVFWLMLTSLKPGWEVFYVHRGTEFTWTNYVDVLQEDIVVRAFINSFVIATLATVISLTVTVTSGYMLSRFKGRIASTWFATIYLFRCIPYISWVLPLYFVTQWWGIYDSYLGLLLPHIAVHICFFSWIMKGFFDGIDPSMEHAALIDGCTRWGAFRRVALPAAIPGVAALAILCWLYTWNEFLFALILTSHQTPMIT
ncbi:MAG: carbohydrate ABC transporter permease, partial [Proteobacteria bacterium]|nr:carbohydrate ABC transporter permease [Pseudomonadota bacterium]